MVHSSQSRTARTRGWERRREGGGRERRGDKEEEGKKGETRGIKGREGRGEENGKGNSHMII